VGQSGGRSSPKGGDAYEEKFSIYIQGGSAYDNFSYLL